MTPATHATKRVIISRSANLQNEVQRVGEVSDEDDISVMSVQYLCNISAIHGLGPKYLNDLLTFKSSLYNLRSSGSILLSMPAVRSKTLGDRAFMVAAPTLWNSLPKELRAITNVNSFKAHIKTYLFRTLYW